MKVITIGSKLEVTCMYNTFNSNHLRTLVIILGGLGRATEMYNAQTKTFTSGPDLPDNMINLSDHCMTRVNNSHVIISGTKKLFCFSFEDEEWDEMDAIRPWMSERGCGVVHLSEGPQLILAGGSVDSGNRDNQYLVQIEIIL